MSILQFLRIFWARRMLIIGAAISCLIGGLVLAQLLPPRWQASSRVLLNTLKPDPVTGQVIQGAATRGFVATQAQLITDYAVAGQVADQLGWLNDANLLNAYNSRSKSDTRDFRRWVAQIVIGNTRAGLVEGSNILEITYTASRAEEAKKVADALRKAYMDTTLAFKREDAQRDFDWFSSQAVKAQDALDQAETAKVQYERENGIVMATDKLDADSARLQSLAINPGVSPQIALPTPGPTASSVKLGEIDAAIAEASKTLGPNHPEIQSMKTNRKVLATMAAQETSAQRKAISAVQAAMSGNSAAMQKAVEEQKAKVIASGGKIGKLSQLQVDVDLRRQEYNHISSRLSETREQAAVADAGVTPLGSAIVPKEPVFPNYTLIVPGSLFLGAAMGTLVALLLELFSRKVRGMEDLRDSIDAPMLAVIAPPRDKPRASKRWWDRFGWIKFKMPKISFWRASRRRVAAV